MSDRVWYAAYGSNLSRERFQVYLRGGVPEGSSRVYPGCRQNAPPAGEQAGSLTWPVRFGGRAATWQNCGGAYLQVVQPYVPAQWTPGDDSRRVPTSDSLTRAWLIQREQLQDVFAQENDWPPGENVPRLDFDLLETEGRQKVPGDSAYDLVVWLGRCQGEPVVTFTCERPPEPAWNPPSRQYLAHIVTGLHEMFPEDRASDYVRRILTPPVEGATRVAGYMDQGRLRVWEDTGFPRERGEAG